MTTARPSRKAREESCSVSRILARSRKASRHSTGIRNSERRGLMRIASRLVKIAMSGRTRRHRVVDRDAVGNAGRMIRGDDEGAVLRNAVEAGRRRGRSRGAGSHSPSPPAPESGASSSAMRTASSIVQDLVEKRPEQRPEAAVDDLLAALGDQDVGDVRGRAAIQDRARRDRTSPTFLRSAIRRDPPLVTMGVGRASKAVKPAGFWDFSAACSAAASRTG